MKSTRAFTLIELIVVVAIIALLAVVILAALGTSRDKGSDAGVKRSLIEARKQAEVFYAANGNRYVGSYGTATDVCSPLADGSATNGTKGMYTQFAQAAQIAGIATADIQTSRLQAGASTKATCHACPKGITSGVCGGANSDGWAMEVPLKTGGFWCIDSTGYSAHNPSTALASGDTRCI